MVIDKPYEEIIEFIGCYKKDDNTFKLVLPKINSIYDTLIWIHEYSHALFLDDEYEIFPNLMESYYINKYVLDIDKRKKIINKTKKEVNLSNSTYHKIGKKIKILNIEI